MGKKEEKISVLAILAGMDQKDDKPKKKGSSSRAKTAPKDSSDERDTYTVIMGSKTSELEGEDNVKDIITINSFSISVGGKEVVKNASLMISHGKRYGLVGANGTGKSCLLKVLAWRKIPVPKIIDILLVEQEAPPDTNSAVKAVVSANEELIKCREKVTALEDSSSDDDIASGEELAELYDKLQMLESDVAEARASKILVGLGFTEDMLAKSTEELSGGWRMRISLARALFVRPSLLLLDEPTNYLDLRAVLWLAEYLCRWKNTLVVVSHGVDFLNTVCTDIIHLDDKNLHSYRKIIAMDEDGPAPRKWRDYSVALDFPEPTELPRPLLQLIEVSFCYPNRPGFRLSNVDVGIDMGTRVAIVGPNGAGKSTLLKLVAGDLVPTEGEVRRSQKLRIGKYSQHFVDQLPMEETPVQYLLRLHPDQEAVRVKLGNFGVPSHNHLTPIAKLSGGDKARVVLASISMSKPHILLLDEPTNHLDMQTVDALADALGRFKGGVVLVSHDSRLISRVCEEEEKSEIWVVEDGAVTFFQGTFEEYKEELKREIKAEVDDLTSLVGS